MAGRLGEVEDVALPLAQDQPHPDRAALSLERIPLLALATLPPLPASADLRRQARRHRLPVELLEHLDRRAHLLRQQERARLMG